MLSVDAISTPRHSHRSHRKGGAHTPCLCAAKLSCSGRVRCHCAGSAHGSRRAPEASLLELRSTMRAFRFCMESMWAEVSRLNLIEGVPALEVPVVFRVGRRDPWIPAEISVRTRSERDRHDHHRGRRVPGGDLRDAARQQIEHDHGHQVASTPERMGTGASARLL